VYRVYHAESDGMLTLHSHPSSRLHRTVTRISSFAITPRSTYRNGPLTASATLSAHTSSGWHPLANAQVGLSFRPKGDRTWYLIDKGRTSSSGRMTLQGKAYKTGSWAVFYKPDHTHFYSESGISQVVAN
jgi:hypothetical protein